MSEPEEDSGFLSRWSRRKTQARVDPPAAGDTGTGAWSSNDNDPLAAGAVPPMPAGQAAEASPVPLPDIETLAPDGDFSPFMAKGVDAATRNQAMKKLFTDPHYGFDNMDKLDIYLDDYSKPDPIPLEMLRGLNQAKRLFLFEDEEKQEAADAQRLAAIQAGAASPVSPALPGMSGDPSGGEIESKPPPVTVIANTAQPK